MRLFRWICTESKYDLCQKCNTELATEQLGAKQAEAKQEAAVVVAGASPTALAKAQGGGGTQAQNGGAGEARRAEPPAAA